MDRMRLSVVVAALVVGMLALFLVVISWSEDEGDEEERGLRFGVAFLRQHLRGSPPASPPPPPASFASFSAFMESFISSSAGPASSALSVLGFYTSVDSKSEITVHFIIPSTTPSPTMPSPVQKRRKKGVLGVMSKESSNANPALIRHKTFDSSNVIFVLGPSCESLLHTMRLLDQETVLKFSANDLDSLSRGCQEKNLFDIASQILQATSGSLLYDPLKLITSSTTEMKTLLSELFGSISSHAISTSLISATTDHVVLVLPPASSLVLLPLLLARFRESYFIIATLHGIEVAFDPTMQQASRALGPYLVDETQIDEACTKRRNPSVSSSPSQLPCTIREVPILRSAVLWSQILGASKEIVSISEEATWRKGKIHMFGVFASPEQYFPANLTNFFIQRQLLLRPPTPSPYFEYVKLNGSSQTNETVFQNISSRNLHEPIFDSQARVRWTQSPLLHKALFNSTLSLISESTLFSFGFLPLPLGADQIPERPSETPVDAGSCWTLKGAKGDRENEVPYAYCLPSFLVIGAQKAGTDELAVWLNFSPFLRRLDGGPEIHFFDCVGRGRGKDRSPCFRLRDSAMMIRQTRPLLPPSKILEKEPSPPPETSSLTLEGEKFMWSRVRTSSPYLSDHWQKYASLGHLDYLRYSRIHRTLLFEKSPSYMDLADPRDVVLLLPSVKIIFLLRDPVDRIFSGYWQNCLTQESERSQNLSGEQIKCSTARFTTLTKKWAMSMKKKGVDLKASDSSPHQSLEEEEELAMFSRSVKHGQYARHIARWRLVYPDDQFLILFSDHFKFYPQAVVHLLENFVGNTGNFHHLYNPHFKDGYYVLGDYSKAIHPSHGAVMQQEARDILQAHYENWNRDLMTLLQDSTSPDDDGLLKGVRWLHKSPSDYLHGNSDVSIPRWLSKYQKVK